MISAPAGAAKSIRSAVEQGRSLFKSGITVFKEGSVHMHRYSRRQFLEGGASGVAALSFGLSPLCAQEWARKAVDQSPRRREWVPIKHDGRSVESFVAYPQSKSKAPAMVVIHEIFGLTDWVEEVSDEFAEAGFLAVA